MSTTRKSTSTKPKPSTSKSSSTTTKSRSSKSGSTKSRSSKPKPKAKEKTDKKLVIQKVFDYAVTAVIRRLAKEGLSFQGIRAVLAANKVKLGDGGVKDSTIRTQMSAGRKGLRGDPAKLSRTVIKEAKAIAKKVEDEKVAKAEKKEATKKDD